MELKRLLGAVSRILTAYTLAAILSASVAAYTEEEEQEAASGADASNPTAAVNFQDLRYRYFDLKDGAEKHSFETEGAYMFHPRFKFTNELRGVNTNRSGDWETDFEQLELRGIFLTDGQPLGIKAKYALGLSWIKNLGDFDKSTGPGVDIIAPLAGIGWVPTEMDFVITLVQFFASYQQYDGAPQVRQTGPRLIYIRKIPQIGGWIKADWKGSIDHKDSNDFSSTLELQLGKMFTPRVGMYGEALIGDEVLETDAYDWGLGLGVRFMY